MKTIEFSAIILVVCISYASLEIAIRKDYFTDFSAKNGTGTNNSCTRPGLTCKNCTDLVYCEEVNGTLIEHDIKICGYNGTTCYNDTCTSAPNPSCTAPPVQNSTEFICRTPGTFPDPFNCKKYHYCLPGDLNNNTIFDIYSYECDCGYSYNSQTAMCDITLIDDECWYSEIPQCIYSGQTGTWWDNLRFYYICLPHPQTYSLYPFMYACENGKVYDPNEYVCKWN